MSKHETWRTRQYWQTVGGLLIEEFVSVNASKLNAKRPIDGLIVSFFIVQINVKIACNARLIAMAKSTN